MLPWFPEQLQVTVLPRRLLLRRAKRAWGASPLSASLPDASEQCADAGPQAPAWRGPVDALGAAALRARGPATATVVIADQFVRYALVPWRADLTRESEALAYARHCITRMYADGVRDWDVRMSPSPRSQARVACAADPDLLAAIRRTLTGSRVRLHSIQPHLMAVFNHALPQLPRRGAWLAVVEPEHLCLALLEHGRWQRLRTFRLNEPTTRELPVLLERERFFVAEGAPRDVYVWDIDADQTERYACDGWQFHRLGGHVPRAARTGFLPAMLRHQG